MKPNLTPPRRDQIEQIRNEFFDGDKMVEGDIKIARWIRSIESSLTQPDWNPSKRKLRKMLYRIRKGSFRGEGC